MRPLRRPRDALDPSLGHPGLATHACSENLAPTYVRVVFANVSAVFEPPSTTASSPSNPCQAASVRLPKRDVRQIEPWTVEQVQAVIAALPDRYRATAVVAAGSGLRQGEVFGLRVIDVDFLRRRFHVQQQVKIVRSRLEVDRPKNGKVRTVPLPDAVAEALSEHLRRYPPSDDGLVFTSREHKPINRNHFNRYVWRPALAARRRRRRTRQRHARPPPLLRVRADRCRRVRASRRRLPRPRRSRLHTPCVRAPPTVVGGPRPTRWWVTCWGDLRGDLEWDPTPSRDRLSLPGSA